MAEAITLREITPANRAAIEALAVDEEQTAYVAGVAESLEEAVATPDARPWFRAVYRAEEPVGFVLISDGITVENPDYLGPYYLWRLLVDRSAQGQGVGTAALDLVRAHLRTRPDATRLLTSAVPGPRSPVTFYERYGFRRTGEVHGGEIVLALDLATPPTPPGPPRD